MSDGHDLCPPARYAASDAEFADRQDARQQAVHVGARDEHAVTRGQ